MALEDVTPTCERLNGQTLTDIVVSAGALMWSGTRLRCLLSRKSRCPKDDTRSSSWMKLTGETTVVFCF